MCVASCLLSVHILFRGPLVPGVLSTPLLLPLLRPRLLVGRQQGVNIPSPENLWSAQSDVLSDPFVYRSRNVKETWASAWAAHVTAPHLNGVCERGHRGARGRGEVTRFVWS